MNPAEPDQERIRQNIARTVGRRALQEVRAMVDAERQERAAYARLLGYVIIVLVLLALLGALAHLLGVF